MPLFKITSSDTEQIKEGEKIINLVKSEKLDSFDESVLGLGKIENKSNTIDGVCAIFDLEGFTTFCTQIDPQLVIPEYLSEFLRWLFLQIRENIKAKKYPNGYDLYALPPLFSKFMGDGVLFLWDVSHLTDIGVLNVVSLMRNICENYKNNLLKRLESNIVSTPKKLRCGVARGQVYTVGDGNDFVGPCINMAARLQKFGSFSFCFSRRGLNPELNKPLSKEIIKIKSKIVGISSDEIICVLKSEYDILSKEEKRNLK